MARKSLRAILSDIGVKGATAPPSKDVTDVLLHENMVYGVAATLFNKKKDAARDALKAIVDRKKVDAALIKTSKTRDGQKVDMLKSLNYRVILNTRNPSEQTDIDDFCLRLLARGVNERVVQECRAQATFLTKPAEGYTILPINEEE